MAIVDASGTVQNSYTYDVYGKLTKTGSLANEFDFAGQQTDSTGLQYLRARYMDPETGTFVSRDPMSSSPAWTYSPHSYVEANPANLTDLTGLYAGNKTEKAWCRGNPLRAKRCWDVGHELAEYAERATQAGYGESTDDGLSNAFRHCCWMGLIAASFGESAARGFGIRHETLLEGEPGYNDPEKAVKSAVDLWNNEIGFAIGTAARNGTARRGGQPRTLEGMRRSIVGACKQSVSAGKTINSRTDSRLP